MRPTHLLGLLILLVNSALSGSAAHAGVELTRLEAGNLSSAAPETRSLGVAPGDILLSNPFMKVVLKATAAEDETGIGRAIVWQGLPASAVQFDSGIGVDWNAAEAGCNGRVAVVRYRMVQNEWEAALVYKLYDNGPWLDVMLTLTNKHKSANLEVPAMFQLRLPTESKVEQPQGMVWVANGPNRQSAAIFPEGSRFLVQEQSKGLWWLASISGDDEPSVVKRVGRKLPLIRRFTAEPPFRPLEVWRDWPRKAHDRSHWYRIEPGQQRVVHWKIVVGQGDEHTRKLVEFAQTGKEPAIQLIPSEQAQAPQPLPPVEAPKRIVGHLRNAPQPQVQPQRQPAPQPSNFYPPAPVLNGPALTAPTGSVNASTVDEAPLALPPSLGDIPDLPFPEE